MIVPNACVLLSGGMDSVAVLFWAKERYPNIVAFMFDYGQQNRDQELSYACECARSLGVPWGSFALADALPRTRGILKGIEPYDGLTEGLSPAFVPGRNLLFITSATAHGSVYFPNGNFDVIIGSNGQDAPRFPDCSHGALIKMSQALRHGVAREINIVAPFVDRTKEQILRSLNPDAIDAVSRSWSCYCNVGPCGKCGACVLRREAFEAVGLADLCAQVKMTGGDPARSH